MKSAQFPTITAYKREDFRKWLKKHHKKENKVAVILHKRHTGKPAPSHRELIEEVISFGWIDTILNRLNKNAFIRNFSKRTHASRWSENTLGYAKELIKKGMMSEEGMKFYKLGLTKPTHDHGIPKNPNMPLELKMALLKNKKAKKNFESFPPSTKRTYYRWLLHAKLPKTRNKRVKQIVQSAISKNKNFLNPNAKANN